jgi:hypothetical protein
MGHIPPKRRRKPDPLSHPAYFGLIGGLLITNLEFVGKEIRTRSSWDKTYIRRFRLRRSSELQWYSGILNPTVNCHKVFGVLHCIASLQAVILSPNYSSIQNGEKMARPRTYLIRFRAIEDGWVHLGQIDAKRFPDVGMATL